MGLHNQNAYQKLISSTSAKYAKGNNVAEFCKKYPPPSQQCRVKKQQNTDRIGKNFEKFQTEMGLGGYAPQFVSNII